MVLRQTVQGMATPSAFGCLQYVTDLDLGLYRLSKGDSPTCSRQTFPVDAARSITLIVWRFPLLSRVCGLLANISKCFPGHADASRQGSERVLQEYAAGIVVSVSPSPTRDRRADGRVTGKCLSIPEESLAALLAPWLCLGAVWRYSSY